MNQTSTFYNFTVSKTWVHFLSIFPVLMGFFVYQGYHQLNFLSSKLEQVILENNRLQMELSQTTKTLNVLQQKLDTLTASSQPDMTALNVAASWTPEQWLLLTKIGAAVLISVIIVASCWYLSNIAITKFLLLANSYGLKLLSSLEPTMNPGVREFNYLDTMQNTILIRLSPDMKTCEVFIKAQNESTFCSLADYVAKFSLSHDSLPAAVLELVDRSEAVATFLTILGS